MIIKKKLKKNFESKTLQIIQESLNDDKVLDLKIINIEKKAFFADYIIIASGTSKRHISTMAKNLRKKVKNILNYTPTIEGIEQSDWVLIDVNSTIVNIFKPETRNFYNLEKLWEE